MNERLGFWRRLKLAGGIVTRGAAALDDVPDGILPPARRAECDPLTLSTVFRGVQVLQTAITGLPINETRNGIKLDTVSALVQRPDINRSRRDFLADIVASMVLDGNAFIRLVRYGGEIVTCEVLPPQLVTVSDDGHDPASPRLRYGYLGRDYKAKFYTDSSNIKGYVTTEQKVSLPTLKALKDDWGKDGQAGQVRFVSDGLKYVPLDLKPADLQFLETQKFDTTQIARLLGIPASIMLAAVDGSNLTYQNIEQSWIEFADYTLAAYAGEIEELFNRLLPRGREARFDWDSSGRTNTSERYAAYASALEHQWMTVDEVRADRGLPPLASTPEPVKENQQ